MLLQKTVALFTIALCLCLRIGRSATSNTTTTTASPGADSQGSGTTSDGTSIPEKTSLEKGIDDFYELTHGFLDSVQRYDFISDSGNAAITYKEIEGIIKNGTYSELQRRWQDLVKVFGGYAACFIVGLLFCIFMPIAGLFFCCCFCCCKRCGKARSKEDPKSAKCKRTTYCMCFTAFATIILAGAIVALISGQLLHIKLRNSDQRGPVQFMNVGVNKLVHFATETTEQIIRKGKNTVETTVAGVNTRIEGTADSTVQDVVNLINAGKLLNDTDRLGTDANSTYNDLLTVNSTLNELQTLTITINTTLQEVASNCTANGIPNCPSIPSLGPDFSSLTSFTAVTAHVLQSLDIFSLSKTARAEFNIVTQNVSTKLSSVINDAKSQANKIQNESISKIYEVNSTVQPLINTLETDTKSSIADINQFFLDYGDYIWYGCIGVACSLILIVVFYYFALLFGLCGERPGHNAPCCNRGAGSNLIVAGVVFSFFFSWILMYIVMGLFFPGGLLYSNFCKYLNQGVENVEKYEVILSDNFGIDVESILFGDDSNKNFTLGGALSDCKDNQGFFNAFQLQNVINLDEALNISQLVHEVNKLVDQTIPNFDNIDIIPPSLNNSLNEFVNSGLLALNFSDYDAQLSTPVVNLTSIIANFTAASLTHEAAVLQSLQDNEIKSVNTKMNEMRTAITRLKNTSSLQNDVNRVVDGLQNAQSNFNANGTQLVKNALRTTVDGLVSFVNNSIETVKNTIKNEIGHCRDVYDAAQLLSDSVCVLLLDPLNGFWFGIGWGLAFFIPAIIFGLLLANLYQREEPFDRQEYNRQKRYKQEQDFENPDLANYQDRDNIPLTNVDRGNYPRGNNGAVNAGYNYQHNDHHNRRADGFDDPYRQDYRDRDPYYRNGERGQPPPYDYHSPPRGSYPVLPKQRY